MKKIIYIDGALADEIGAMDISALAAHVAQVAKQDVDILTHGHSKYHAEKRFTGIYDGA